MNHRSVIIVGTGRCGSTALTNMVRLHPRWLSISEFFMTSWPQDSGKLLSAEAYLQELITPRPDHTALLRARIEPEEFLYPVDAGFRQNRNSGVSPVLLMTLAHLTSDPDGLLDELSAEIRTWPDAEWKTHSAKTFEWLRTRYSADLWIERSGASMFFADSLVDMFPDVAFIHIHRSGADCVRSMAKHSLFRLGAVRWQMKTHFHIDPYAGEEPTQALRESAFGPFLPDKLDGDSFMKFDIPMRWFASMWMWQTVLGMKALAKVPPERILHLSYDGLVADPTGTARRMGEFISPGAVDPEWVSQAAAVIRERPARQPVPLDPEAQALIDKGENVLRQHGLL